jgi:microsomal dipeptidase-like Zn-dependent dipeptidase
MPDPPDTRIADLHCHYPMHLLPEVPDLDAKHAEHRPPRWSLWQGIRARIIRAAARRINDTTTHSGWRVSFDGLVKGHVRIVLSVLYLPDGELEPWEFFGAAPEQHWFDNLIAELDKVEADLAIQDDGRNLYRIIHTLADLKAARAADQVAIIHAVEGGFHLGHDPDDVEPRVAELAKRGVGYITLAHLFWRKVATNSPAIPKIPERIYKLLFPMPRRALSPVGEEAVRAMYKRKILVDLSHMNARAIKRTLEILPSDFPVVATHTGCRFGLQSYNLDKRTIRAIKDRGGVIGLIMAQHQLNNGFSRWLKGGRTRSFEDTVKVICRHIDRIHEITRSYDNIALGTDLDGFIKPTMTGIEGPADLQRLREPLELKYPGHADAILYGNAERVLRTVFAAR